MSHGPSHPHHTPAPKAAPAAAPAAPRASQHYSAMHPLGMKGWMAAPLIAITLARIGGCLEKPAEKPQAGGGAASAQVSKDELGEIDIVTDDVGKQRILGEMFKNLIALKDKPGVTEEEIRAAILEPAVATGGMVDPVTNRVLCQRQAQIIADNPTEPVVEVEACGKTLRLRQGMAQILRAVEQEMAEDQQKPWHFLRRTRKNQHKWDCPHVTYAERNHLEQYQVWIKRVRKVIGSLPKGGKLPEDPVALYKFLAVDPKTRIVDAGYPCASNGHEAADAVDVVNWEQADGYFQKHGISGGRFGMAQDRPHFGPGVKKRGYLDVDHWWTRKRTGK